VKVDYVEETAVRKALTFEIDVETVNDEIDTRAREYSRRAKIPGFRPGKIPMRVIKERFRQQVLDDVAEKIVNKVVFEEIEGRGLKPIASPQVADLKLEEGAPMTFRAVFETLPLIDPPEYKGLEAKGRNANVSDEDIDKEIEAARNQAARLEPIEDRPAAEGDFVVADTSWRPVDGGRTQRSENAVLEVGAEDNHQALNDALVGVEAGAESSVRLQMADDHHDASLAGKSIDYKFTVKAVKKKVLPDLDDEFAKDLDFEDVAALREAVRQRNIAADERKIDREIKKQLVDTLVTRSSFEVPEALVESHMTGLAENAARSLAASGIDPQKAGIDWRQYRDAQKEEARKAAKADILLDEIGRLEGVEVLDAEMDSEIERLAQRMHKSKEALRAQMEKEGDLRALRSKLREEKILDLLKSSATLTYE